MRAARAPRSRAAAASDVEVGAERLVDQPVERGVAQRPPVGDARTGATGRARATVSAASGASRRRELSQPRLAERGRHLHRRLAVAGAARRPRGQRERSDRAYAWAALRPAAIGSARARHRAPPLHQPLDDHVEHRREDQAEEGDAEHAGEHRHAHGVPHLGAGAAGEHQRHHAHDERERGHEDRAEPDAAGLERRFDRASGPRICSSRANSTIRMAFLQARPTSTRNPIWVKMLLSPRVSHTPVMAQSRHIGTIRMTASGSDQLSYCAASTRNASSTQSGKTKIAVLPARICW